MNSKSRVENSIKNTITGLACQITSVIMSFIVRTFFIRYLNEEYLGVNGLFTNILTVLSIAELGFGSAMAYSMYKPVANEDIKKIKALISLYKKVYFIIGVIVIIIGMLVIPFLKIIIKDTLQINHLTLIYLLFLVNSSISYFWAHKKSILTVDQQEYIYLQYKYFFIILKSILQILIIVIFKSFVLYLVIQILITFTENISISMRVNKEYPFLKENNHERVSDREKNKIKNDVKALAINKFSNVMLKGTDNILISAFVGIKWVGLLSNYNMVTGALIMILSQITSGITGSIGNYIVNESIENQYKLFRKVDFIIFYMYSFCLICLITLFNPFVKLWIGDNFVLTQTIVIVISINFVIDGIVEMLWLFRATMGLFVQGKYRPLMTAFFNIIISIILAKYMGVLGVVLGTTISRVLVDLSYNPYVIFKYGFKYKIRTYYISLLKRILTIIFICIIMQLIKEIFFKNTITYLNFFILSINTVIISNLILFILYHNTEEFKYLISTIKNVKVIKVLNRKLRNYK